jgi:hypothetical protein
MNIGEDIRVWKEVKQTGLIRARITTAQGSGIFRKHGKQTVDEYGKEK